MLIALLLLLNYCIPTVNFWEKIRAHKFNLISIYFSSERSFFFDGWYRPNNLPPCLHRRDILRFGGDDGWMDRHSSQRTDAAIWTGQEPSETARSYLKSFIFMGDDSRWTDLSKMEFNILPWFQVVRLRRFPRGVCNELIPAEYSVAQVDCCYRGVYWTELLLGEWQLAAPLSLYLHDEFDVYAANCFDLQLWKLGWKCI